MTNDTAHNIQSQVKRLASNGIALAFGGIVAQLAFTLLEILIARNLGAEAYGTFVTAYACTVLSTFVMEFGTPQWTIQEGSRSHERLPLLLGSSLAINLALFVVLYVLLVILANAVNANPVLTFLLILLPYGLILTLQGSLSAVYASYQTMQITAFFQGFAPVAILLAYLVFSAQELELPDVGYAYLVGSGIVTGAWFAFTLRKIRPRFSTSSIRNTFFSSYQYGLTGVLGHIFFKTDIIMLSVLAGLSEAGIYAAAFKLVDLVQKVAVLAGRVFAPVIFKASHESEKSFKLFSSMMTRFMAIVGLLAGIVSVVMADELILLTFGESYTASIPVLRILGGVMASMSMLVAMQLLLSSIDLHAQRVAYLGVTVVVQIGANVILIPKFGAVGAAISCLVSGILIIVLYALAASRRRDFRFLRWLLLPSSLAAVVAIAVILAGINAYIGALASASMFVLGLFAMQLVRPDEIEFVLRSVLPDKKKL